MTNSLNALPKMPSILEGGFVMPRSIQDVNFTPRIIGCPGFLKLMQPQRKLAPCRIRIRSRLA